MPGLQRLSYAGKNMEDSQRTLQQYAVAPRQNACLHTVPHHTLNMYVL